MIWFSPPTPRSGRRHWSQPFSVAYLVVSDLCHLTPWVSVSMCVGVVGCVTEYMRPPQSWRLHPQRWWHHRHRHVQATRRDLGLDGPDLGPSRPSGHAGHQGTVGLTGQPTRRLEVDGVASFMWASWRDLAWKALILDHTSQWTACAVRVLWASPADPRDGLRLTALPISWRRTGSCAS
jgi:hypothetical protein